MNRSSLIKALRRKPQDGTSSPRSPLDTESNCLLLHDKAQTTKGTSCKLRSNQEFFFKRLSRDMTAEAMRKMIRRSTTLCQWSEYNLVPKVLALLFEVSVRAASQSQRCNLHAAKTGFFVNCFYDSVFCHLQRKSDQHCPQDLSKVSRGWKKSESKYEEITLLTLVSVRFEYTHSDSLLLPAIAKQENLHLNQSLTR